MPYLTNPPIRRPDEVDAYTRYLERELELTRRDLAHATERRSNAAHQRVAAQQDAGEGRRRARAVVDAWREGDLGLETNDLVDALACWVDTHKDH